MRDIENGCKRTDILVQKCSWSRMQIRRFLAKLKVQSRQGLAINSINPLNCNTPRVRFQTSFIDTYIGQMIRTGLPAELRRWPLRVPTGLRRSQSRQRHSTPKSLDVPIDIPVEMLALPRHYKEHKPSRHPKAASSSRLPCTSPSAIATNPTVPTSSKAKIASIPPIRLQPDERSSPPLSLYPKLSKLIDQVGRLEHSFEAVIEAFMKHIDELVSVRPLVVRVGKAEVEQRYLGSVEGIKTKLALRSQSQFSASASGSSDSEEHQEPNQVLRGRRHLTRKQMTRIDYCLQAVLRHPNGLDAGKRILDRLLEEGIVPGQEGLTMVLKGTIRALQHRGYGYGYGRDGDIASEDVLLEAETDGTKKEDLLAAQRFCKLLLQRVPYADAHLFNLIVTLQIAARVPSAEIIKLVADYMQVNKRGEVGKWTPQGFDLIMRAYRREGDVRGVRRWYGLYLQSRGYQRRQREQEQRMEQEEEEGSGLERSDDVSRARPGSRDGNGSDEKARIWPYIIMLHANADARRAHPHLPLTRGAYTYTPSGEHATDIVRHILADDLDIPSEVYGYLINRAMGGGDLGLAGRLCEMALSRARGNNENDENDNNKKEGHRTGLKPKVWEYAFDLMARSKSFRTRMGGVRGLVKEMIRAPFRPQVTSSSSPSSWSSASASASASYSAEAEAQRRVYTAIVRAALSNDNGDFPLALWAVEQQQQQQQWGAFPQLKLGLDAKMVDTVARSVLEFAIERNRGEGWVREVLGEEGVGVVCRPGRIGGDVEVEGKNAGRVKVKSRTGSTSGTSGRGLSRFRTPGLRRQRGVRLEHWNVVSWRLYRLSVELAERRKAMRAQEQERQPGRGLEQEQQERRGRDHIEEGLTAMDRMIYLPLSRPLARLERTCKSRSIDMRHVSSIHAQLYDYRWWRETTGAEGIRANRVALGEAVRELLRRGIGARGLIKGQGEGQAGGVVDVEAEMRELGREIGSTC